MGDDAKSPDRLLLPPPLPQFHGDQTSWVLLDLLAYIADQENSTSAYTEMSDGTRIRVTLCAASPPLVSYLCVWCPDQKPGVTPRIKRCVVEAADSDLVFLYVSLRSRRVGPCDCFVYKASSAGKGPSLHRIKLPYCSMSTHHEIALLPYSDLQAEDGGGSMFRLFPYEDDELVVSSPHKEAVSFHCPHLGDGDLEDASARLEGGVKGYLPLLSPHEEDDDEDSVSHHRHEEGDSNFCVALLDLVGSSAAEQHYELFVFHSTDGQWRHMHFSISCCCHHLTYKVINLGQGGLIAFVDPWRGIIVCDVLGRQPPRYLPLPEELIDHRSFGMPLLYRDIALVEGSLTLVDLSDIGELDADLNCQKWMVSTWSRKVTRLWEEDWSQEYIVQSGDFSLKDATGVDLLPKVMGSTRPTLELPYMAHPTLSLRPYHIVYVMGKHRYHDKKVLLMSLDMKERRLQEVTLFDAERMVGVPFDYSYMHYRIPKYFKQGDSFNTSIRPIV